MTWKRLNGFRRRCPVCNNLNRRDCRENTANNLIHCRDPLANPIDWVFRGIDALGFAMWANKAEAEAWAEEQREEQREEWLRQWQLKREQEQRKEAEDAHAVWSWSPRRDRPHDASSKHRPSSQSETSASRMPRAPRAP